LSLVARLTLNKENDISIAPRILLASYMVVVGSLGTTPVLPPVSAVKPLAQIDNLISPPKTLTWDEQLAPQLARAEQQRVDEAARLQAIAAQAAAEAAEREIEAQAVRFTYRAPQTAYTALQSGELTGSLGYARAGGNCTMEPGVNNPWNGTNPIDWPILSETPTIGATVAVHLQPHRRHNRPVE